eukprot:GGOE01036763.1.p1 GENE.GGOE01036763.1~~GGOE01036763.1.p1  ORF type:complete len:1140 (-),score=413.15 GGOE01036763.1:106-3372(-)
MAESPSPMDPKLLEELCASIAVAADVVRTLKEKAAPEDQLESAINTLMTLKVKLTDFVGVGGHEQALNKSAYKKEKKRLESLSEKPKVKQEFKQGEGRNSKLAKKMLEKRQTDLQNKTPPGEKKILDEEMAKEYDPEAVEMAWYAWWEASGCFKPRDTDTTSEKFVMVIPPPNVTGSLHIGHALTCSIEDLLTRWHRMKGHNTLWVPGTDHAGIATQVVVEKQLYKDTKQTRQDLGREGFLEKVWEWKNAKGNHIYNQLRLTGASVDWSREAFTMNDKLSRAVLEAFCRLHERGKIYRDTKLTDWCCTLQSVISKIEIDNVELEGETKLQVPGYDKKVDFGFIYSFAYPVLDSDEVIVVATTRPETMLGDTAVAVHPDDPRHKHLHGRFVKHPFLDRKIPIICDPILVDMNFGTGAVKITPAHDPNDFACGKRHGLEFIDVMTDTGEMTAGCGEFAGMKRFDCRVAVMKRLDEMGLGRGKAPNPMTIPLCSRTGDVLEPRVKPQWYCDCSEMAARAVAAVDAGELRIIPSSHEAVWRHWLNNIQDWCISRQLWWGHRIPAYYVDFVGEPEGAKSDVNRWVVGRTVEEAKQRAAEKFGRPVEDLILSQDEDVLDTWFSSGLFPFSTMGWPEETNDFHQFFPGSLLETGYDILFFWVARMVMFALELTDKLPFRDVFLHTIVRDKYGQKMSKSKGNVIDPLWVVYGITLEELHTNVASGNLPEKEVQSAQKAQREQFPEGIAPCGADGLRYALLLNCSLGSDINLDINGVVSCRNFCNKIWQATRLSTSNLEGFTPAARPMEGCEELSLVLRWLLSRLNHMLTRLDAAFQAYDFHEVAEAGRAFFWEEFCDVFLEYTKRIFQNPDHPMRPAARETLYTVLETTFRALHPTLPFLTEELWQRLPKRAGVTSPSIMLAEYPMPVAGWTDVKAEAQMELVLAIAKAMRATKVNYKMAPKATPRVTVRVRQPDLQALVRDHIEDFQKLSGVGEVEVVVGDSAPVGYVVTTVSEQVDVLMELAGNVDVAAEVAKLEKEKLKLEQTRDKLRAEQDDVAKYSKKPEAKQREDAERLAKWAQEIEQKEKDIASFRMLA